MRTVPVGDGVHLLADILRTSPLLHAYDPFLFRAKSAAAGFRRPAREARPSVGRSGGVGRPAPSEWKCVDIHEDDPLDEAQFAAWVKQASQLPGERM
jgi:hypothetical protein